MLDVQRNKEVIRRSEVFTAPDEPATGPSRGWMPQTVEWINMRRPNIFGDSHLYALQRWCRDSPEPGGQLHLGGEDRIVHT